MYENLKQSISESNRSPLTGAFDAEMTAAGRPDTDPLIAWGFDPIYFGGERMTVAHVDRASLTRPIVISHANGHLMNVNSAMLRLGEIDRDIDDSVPDFQDILGVPVVMMGFGLPDDNAHAPNEKVHLPTLYRGTEAVIHYFSLLAAQANLR